MSEESSELSQKPASRALLIACVILFVGLLTLAGAVSLGYFQLWQKNTALLEDISTIKNEITTRNDQIQELTQKLQNYQQVEEKSLALSNQQEKLLQEWQAAQNGDLSKWRMAEAEYFVKLANDQLQFTHNNSLAIALLQRAKMALNDITQGVAPEIAKMLEQNMATLQALPQVDVNSIYQQLSSLNEQIKQLPLITDVNGKEENVAATNAISQVWWRAALERISLALNKVVVVRNLNQTNIPVLIPEEKVFLYQNLQAQIQYAIWGLLHQNNDVYQTSLSTAETWIKEYFSQEAPATQGVLQKLSSLVKLNVAVPSTLSLDETIQLFNAPKEQQ